MGRDRNTPQRFTNKVSKRRNFSWKANLQKALDALKGKHKKSRNPEEVMPLLSPQQVSSYTVLTPDLETPNKATQNKGILTWIGNLANNLFEIRDS